MIYIVIPYVQIFGRRAIVNVEKPNGVKEYYQKENIFFVNFTDSLVTTDRNYNPHIPVPIVNIIKSLNQETEFLIVIHWSTAQTQLELLSITNRLRYAILAELKGADNINADNINIEYGYYSAHDEAKRMNQNNQLVNARGEYPNIIEALKMCIISPEEWELLDNRESKKKVHNAYSEYLIAWASSQLTKQVTKEKWDQFKKCFSETYTDMNLYSDEPEDIDDFRESFNNIHKKPSER